MFFQSVANIFWAQVSEENILFEKFILKPYIFIRMELWLMIDRGQSLCDYAVMTYVQWTIDNHNKGKNGRTRDFKMIR